MIWIPTAILLWMFGCWVVIRAVRKAQPAYCSTAPDGSDMIHGYWCECNLEQR